MRKPAGTTSDPAARRVHSMADAARLTVLRRVAPALRHDMVVNLQAVSMMAEMLNARIERGSVAAADLQSNLSKLNRLARDAVNACLHVAGWMEASEDVSIPLHEGVRECVGLLAASFNFRGFGLAHEVPEGDFEVVRHALRGLLCASLLAAADRAEHPCDLVVQAQVEPQHATLTIHCREQAQAKTSLPPATHAGPRPHIEWSEVEALAAAEGASVRMGSGRVTIRLPRAVVTSPLQMAPV